MTIQLNTIYNEDCLETMKRMSDESIDLVVTDPPYGVSRKSNWHTQKDRKRRTGVDFGGWDNTDIVHKALVEIERILKPNGAMVMFYDMMKIHEVFIMNPRRLLFWHKTNPMPAYQNPFPVNAVEAAVYTTKSKTGIYNGIKQQNWYTCASPTPAQRKHPTQKPLDLMKWIVQMFSSESDIVYDPFIGSGTTALACKNLGRNYIGSEVSKEYCQVAEERLKQGVLL